MAAGTSMTAVAHMAAGAEQLASEIYAGLEAPMRLKREAALSRLAKQLNNGNAGAEGEEFRAAMCRAVLRLLAADEWQSRLGGLEAAQVCQIVGSELWDTMACAADGLTLASNQRVLHPNSARALRQSWCALITESAVAATTS